MLLAYVWDEPIIGWLHNEAVRRARRPPSKLLIRVSTEADRLRVEQALKVSREVLSEGVRFDFGRRIELTHTPR
jgi:hypothetical protein